MSRISVMLVSAWAAAGFTGPAAAQFAMPRPEVFVRAEDQTRARLLDKPCTAADVGHGCYRWGGGLVREAPCTYHIGPRAIGSVPTDQCYKMEAPRRYRGVWIDEFEGQAFIPEGSKAPEWPKGDPKSAGWWKAFEAARAATIWLDVERTDLRGKRRRGGKMLIEFVGRKTLYPGNYGHMGMSGNEIIVDRVISLQGCPREGACR